MFKKEKIVIEHRKNNAWTVFGSAMAIVSFGEMLFSKMKGFSEDMRIKCGGRLYGVKKAEVIDKGRRLRVAVGDYATMTTAVKANKPEAKAKTDKE
jgi:hypothetical protein